MFYFQKPKENRTRLFWLRLCPGCLSSQTQSFWKVLLHLPFLPGILLFSPEVSTEILPHDFGSMTSWMGDLLATPCVVLAMVISRVQHLPNMLNLVCGFCNPKETHGSKKKKKKTWKTVSLGLCYLLHFNLILAISCFEKKMKIIVSLLILVTFWAGRWENLLNRL